MASIRSGSRAPILSQLGQGKGTSQKKNLYVTQLSSEVRRSLGCEIAVLWSPLPVLPSAAAGGAINGFVGKDPFPPILHTAADGRQGLLILSKLVYLAAHNIN